MNSLVRLTLCGSLLLWFGGIPVHASSTGTTGYSGKDPERHCSTCHTGTAAEPQVTVAGPVTVDTDSTVTYSLSLHGEPGNVGGLNVAAAAGALAGAGDDVELVDGELTHRANRVAADNGTVYFKFRWRAPRIPGTYALYVAGVLGDADGRPTGDSAVHSELRVQVIDRSAAANEPPLAHLQVPPAALVGEKVLLSAKHSADSDGDIVSYAWDFGDGETATGQAPMLQHKYAAAGVYTLQVAVTDDDGATVSALGQIEITDTDNGTEMKRPLAVPGDNYDVAFGDPVQFDGSQSRASHEDGQIVSFEWDFGDGYQGGGIAPTHFYANPGPYIARLTVRDDSGLPHSAITSVTVRGRELPRIAKFKVPHKIVLEDNQPQPRGLDVTADVVGLRADASRCGIVYLRRNSQTVQEQTVCFLGAEPRLMTFNHVFTENDIPSVTWTAYLVLGPDLVSKHRTKQTQVETAPRDQSGAAKS